MVRDSVGCAKEVAEAACKLVAVAHRAPVPASVSTSGLVKVALGCRSDVGGEDVVRRLGSVLDALGTLRNAVGTGHGRAEQDVVTVEVAASGRECEAGRRPLRAWDGRMSDPIGKPIRPSRSEAGSSTPVIADLPRCLVPKS